MKQRILFMCINMNIGGTEKALINMLDEIPKKKYEVTILMLEKYGGFLGEIPNWVNIKYVENYKEIKQVLNNPPMNTVKMFVKNGNILKGINIGISYLTSKVLKNRGIFFKSVLKKYSNIEEEYDVAVAYAGPMDFISYYVLNKISAKEKIQWVHFDIERIYFDKNFANKNYNKFDKIFVVSEEGKSKLNKAIPSICKKTSVFYNRISYKKIYQLAHKEEGFEDNFEGIRILTVGRLAKEKGQDLTIPVLAKLKADGYKIRWYCIGEGIAREEYENLIREYNVEEDYILLGAKSNPYPYMKECDIYVQPSRHEGYCITLAEAKCFNNPIVATNFTGAKEQLQDMKNGIIVKSKGSSIYNELLKIIIEINQNNYKFKK